MREIVTVEVETHYPIQYVSGEKQTCCVRVRRADGSIMNTGRGFDSLEKADLFADGLGMALSTVGYEVRRTDKEG